MYINVRCSDYYSPLMYFVEKTWFHGLFCWRRANVKEWTNDVNATNVFHFSVGLESVFHLILIESYQSILLGHKIFALNMKNEDDKTMKKLGKVGATHNKLGLLTRQQRAECRIKRKICCFFSFNLLIGNFMKICCLSALTRIHFMEIDKHKMKNNNKKKEKQWNEEVKRMKNRSYENIWHHFWFTLWYFVKSIPRIWWYWIFMNINHH